MSEQNDFDLFIGLTLAKLYDERGKGPTLSGEDFGLTDLEDYVLATPERLDMWENTVRWLEREQYLRFGALASGSSNETVFHDMELMEKGFRALNSLPASIRDKTDKRSIGARLVDLGKKTGWRAASKVGEKGADEAAHQISDFVQTWMT